MPRLLDLEESGVFRFWDSDELSALVAKAGFLIQSTHASFGEPVQLVDEKQS